MLAAGVLDQVPPIAGAQHIDDLDDDGGVRAHSDGVVDDSLGVGLIIIREIDQEVDSVGWGRHLPGEVLPCIVSPLDVVIEHVFTRAFGEANLD